MENVHAGMAVDSQLGELARPDRVACHSFADSFGVPLVFCALLARVATKATRTLGTADASQRHRPLPVSDDRVCACVEQVIHRVSACVDHADLVSKFSIPTRACAAAKFVGHRLYLGNRAAHRDANALEGSSGSSDRTYRLP